MTVKRFAAVVSYDGTDFFGFQNQPDMRTVQGIFEEALERIHKFRVSSQGAGRTDTGVHGYGQVIAFDSNLDRLDAPTMKAALNANLPADVYVRKVYEVAENFSPRFAAKKRIYHYYILNSSEPDIFRRRFVWWFPYTLDIESMRRRLKSDFFRGSFYCFQDCGMTEYLDRSIQISQEKETSYIKSLGSRESPFSREW